MKQTNVACVSFIHLMRSLNMKKVESHKNVSVDNID